jgi:hypothetical protein
MRETIGTDPYELLLAMFLSRKSARTEKRARQVSPPFTPVDVPQSSCYQATVLSFLYLVLGHH